MKRLSRDEIRAVRAIFSQKHPTRSSIARQTRLSLVKISSILGGLEKQQVLASQVTKWLQEKDAHKFLRRFIGGSCNKHLSYNTWPADLQKAFDVRFRDMLADPQFTLSICRRILTFQNGHIITPQIAASFITVCAGMLAFAFSEV